MNSYTATKPKHGINSIAASQDIPYQVSQVKRKKILPGIEVKVLHAQPPRPVLCMSTWTQVSQGSSAPKAGRLIWPAKGCTRLSPHSTHQGAYWLSPPAAKEPKASKYILGILQCDQSLRNCKYNGKLEKIGNIGKIALAKKARKSCKKTAV